MKGLRGSWEAEIPLEFLLKMISIPFPPFTSPASIHIYNSTVVLSQSSKQPYVALLNPMNSFPAILFRYCSTWSRRRARQTSLDHRALENTAQAGRPLGTSQSYSQLYPGEQGSPPLWSYCFYDRLA